MDHLVRQSTDYLNIKTEHGVYCVWSTCNGFSRILGLRCFRRFRCEGLTVKSLPIESQSELMWSEYWLYSIRVRCLTKKAIGGLLCLKSRFLKSAVMCCKDEEAVFGSCIHGIT